MYPLVNKNLVTTCLQLINHSLTACRCGTDIAKSTLEALSGMAIDLFRNQQQKNTLTERLSVALKSMLKVTIGQ